MLKPVQFIKPRNVNGPLYETGEVAGFMPELAAQLIAEGTAREVFASGGLVSLGPPTLVGELSGSCDVGTVSGFPFKDADERQAARNKKNGGKR